MLFAWSLYKIGQDNLEAMKACQKTRSYDACAYDIMRWLPKAAEPRGEEHMRRIPEGIENMPISWGLVSAVILFLIFSWIYSAFIKKD